jgi:hypothetical protein
MVTLEGVAWKPILQVRLETEWRDLEAVDDAEQSKKGTCKGKS